MASKGDDPEKKQAERKLVLLGPFYAGCGAALSACKFHFRLIALSLHINCFCRFRDRRG